MSLLRRELDTSGLGPSWAEWSTGRTTSRPSRASTDKARRRSVIWAAQRLRADLESSLPVDVFRQVGDIAVPTAKPGVLIEPDVVADGQPVTFREWRYSSRQSLDATGNVFGEITAFDGLGLPARIHLIADEDVSCRVSKGRIVEYRFGRSVIDPRRVWHERQHTIAGVPLGLSAVVAASGQINAAANAEQFAVDWFEHGVFPGGILKNEGRVLGRAEAEDAKAHFMSAVRAGEPWTTGRDWTYTAASAKAAEAGFIEQMKYTDVDLARFMGVPANLVDAAVQGSNLTYANLTQNQLHFLVNYMGPAFTRREEAWSRLVPRPRFVKMNTKALLRMDPETQTKDMAAQIDARVLTVTEARALMDREPLTPEQIAEFDRLFGAKNQQPKMGAQA